MLSECIRPISYTIAGAFALCLMFHCSAARAQTPFTVSELTGVCPAFFQISGPEGSFTLEPDVPGPPLDDCSSLGEESAPVGQMFNLYGVGTGSPNFDGGVELIGGFEIGGGEAVVTGNLPEIVPVTAPSATLIACYPVANCLYYGYDGYPPTAGITEFPVISPDLYGTATITFFPTGDDQYMVENISYQLTPTPEPSSLLLFGTGLLGIGIVFIARRKLAH
jgi:hypothetical protein